MRNETETELFCIETKACVIMLYFTGWCFVPCVIGVVWSHVQVVLGSRFGKVETTRQFHSLSYTTSHLMFASEFSQKLEKTMVVAHGPQMDYTWPSRVWTKKSFTSPSLRRVPSQITGLPYPFRLNSL